MIIQAGQSGRGKKFGARWGELIFLNYPNIEVGKKSMQNSKVMLQTWAVILNMLK